MVKYRIKTEKEFIREFGESWRKDVQSRFPPKMDILLGIKIEPKIFNNEDSYDYYFGKVKKFKNGFHLYIKCEDSSSGLTRIMISNEMVIVDKTPSYKAKKIIHE